MKKRMIKILIAAMLLLLLPVSLLLTGLRLPSLYGDSYYAVLPQMYHRLCGTEGKKLVVVGGSNVAFGLDGALLEQLLAEQGYEYTVCPFGLYAAVGTSAMLDLSEETLTQGDLVVLAIEPASQTMSTYFGATAFWKCAEDAPDMLSALDGQRRGAMLGNYTAYLQERVSILASGIFPAAEGVYARTSFNDRCDMIYDRPGNVMGAGFDMDTPIDLADVTIEDAFAQQVAEYCQSAQKAGAEVCVSFSPMNRSAVLDVSEETVQAFFDRVNQAFACPVISDPNNYLLDSGWFYDSNFHLNSAGAEVRTYSLAQDILAYLGCGEIPEYTLPQMPQSAVSAELSDTDAGYFTMEAVGDGAAWRISGLTAEGLLQEELTVPAAVDGVSVVGFTANALAGADNLRSLRLPESVESLPAELFRDCKNLTRLILEHKNTPCSITEHTFDGADQIRVFVTEEAYALYRDGYGCEANLWSELLDRIYIQ